MSEKRLVDSPEPIAPTPSPVKYLDREQSWGIAVGKHAIAIVITNKKLAALVTALVTIVGATIFAVRAT
jgi:hypothetical protein